MTIGLSQVIITGAILAFAFYVFGARTVLTDRIIYLVLVCSGLILALYPDLSTRVANAVGIGRGADLLLYIFVLFSLFQYVSIASQMKGMEQRFTAVVRAYAIDHAVAGTPRPIEPVDGDGQTVSDKGQEGN